MGVRVRRRDGTVDSYGFVGDRAWVARREEGGALVVSYLRDGHVEEARRIYRSQEWSRVEIDRPDGPPASARP